MRTNLTTSSLNALLILVGISFATTTYAQYPINDNVCNATNVPLGPTGISMVIDSTTIEPGEQAISPPLGDCTNGWCDGLGIESSVWFTFTAPASGALSISVCGSNYNTQIALYEVGTCSDFGTFTYIFGNDDTPNGTPGQECGPANHGTLGYGLGSEFDIYCLTPGQIYYVIVDTWLAAGDTEPLGKTLNLIMNEITTPPPPPDITNIIDTTPSCPGYSDATATVEHTGFEPITFLWSNGQTGVTATGLASGNYMLTITDFCGATDVVAFSILVIDPGQPPTIGTITILPAGCADGAASIEIATGSPPFTWAWSTGAIGHQPALPAGMHTVSITDKCGIHTITQTVMIPGGTEVANGNFVIDPNTGCSVQFTGVINHVAPFEDNSVSYNVDQTIGGNIACIGGGLISDNGFWRAYDLTTDFNITDDYLLGELELAIFEAEAMNQEGFQPIEVRIYTITTVDLSVSTNTLVKTVPWTIADRDTSNSGFIRIPLNYLVPAGQLFAIEVFNPDGTPPLNRRLALGANTSPALGGSETYITSTGCGITTPTAMSVIGFPHQTVFNLVEYTYGVTWSPAIDLDDTTVLAPVLTSPAPVDSILTYTATVMDGCGLTQVVTATVDASACLTSGNEELVEGSFTIAPNPGNGLFNITNEGSARELTLEVFDLGGRVIVSRLVYFEAGAIAKLDLTAVPAGLYLVKFSDGAGVEVCRLVVE